MEIFGFALNTLIVGQADMRQAMNCDMVATCEARDNMYHMH